MSAVQKSYRKNILREMKGNASRMVSLFGIVALGVMMLTGLMSIAPSMRSAAQKYYVQQNVFDLRVLSTLGLSDQDIAAIAATPGVEAVMPVKTLDLEANWQGQEERIVVQLQALQQDPAADTDANMNRLVLRSGRMPQAANECVVHVMGYQAEIAEGTVLTLPEDTEGTKHKEYTVVGLVQDPQHISTDKESSTVGNGQLNYIAYVLDGELTADYYTACYIKAENAGRYDNYSQEYQEAVDQVADRLEQIRTAVQQTVVPGYPHFRLSLSIGGAMQTLADPMENVVRRADFIMYQAKNHKGVVEVDTQDSRLAAQKDVLGEKPVILLVDDSMMNRMMLAGILGDDYRILEAENGKQCLELLRANAGQTSLVLLDINMPVMDGFEVLRTMNTNHTIEDVPVIMISSDDSEEAIRKAYELGASDYVSRPFDAKIVYRRVVNTIKLYAKQRRLVQMVSDQIRAREKNTDVLVGVLSQIVEFRNGESGSHVRHIRIITETLLHRLMELTSRYDLTPEQQDDIPLASALHDIGKIGIDEAILNKPGKLTAEEFAVIKTHSMLGAEMLQKTESFADQPLLQTAYEIARWHHERWDGKGYPDGLKGDDIPISAQLVSMADVYDALTSERCYKKAFPHETAVQMITNGACGAFNPLLIQCLLDVQGELKQEILQW